MLGLDIREATYAFSLETDFKVVTTLKRILLCPSNERGSISFSCYIGLIDRLDRIKLHVTDLGHIVTQSLEFCAMFGFIFKMADSVSSKISFSVDVFNKYEKRNNVFAGE